MIAEELAGKRIAITGSTGFVGTALVERLLRSVPGCSLVLLIRGGKRGAPERARREIFKNDCFDRLKTELNGSGETFEEMIERRVTTINGDVSSDGLGLNDQDRALLATCDIVIHSAASVSFDSPLDPAVEVNLMGPVRVAATLNELRVTPHLVAISTCYVAGNRRGNAPEALASEGPFDLGLDWRNGGRGGPALSKRHGSVQADDPHNCARFRRPQLKELGAAGAPALAAKTEQLRERWVHRRTRRRRSGARGEPWLAGRIRVHEGPRRAGAHRNQGRCSGQYRAPIDHRVGARPSRGRVGFVAFAWPSRSSSATPGVC